MPRGREIPLTQRGQIIGLRKDGHSLREISSLLDMNISTIHYIILHWENYGTIKDEHRSGRPKIMSPRAMRVLNSFVKKNRWSTLDKITSDFNKLALMKPISANTMRRRLYELKYKPCVLRKIAKNSLKSGDNSPRRKAPPCNISKGHIRQPILRNIKLELHTYFYSIPIYT
ncbi:hypothetical protein LOD99_1005 [Oopsacas minuta]|uniref:Transposase Tc1-like domain-containing protein n=1 Tax=Oopsacas minuta TaxID=111878 RepID=A0AAV7K1M6_9METZ|nr:hypothetical protein LOD99_1005 [Oopsacas minuta]